MANLATQIIQAFPDRPLLYIETSTKDHFIGKITKADQDHIVLERDDGRLIMLMTAHIVLVELSIEATE